MKKRGIIIALVVLATASTIAIIFLTFENNKGTIVQERMVPTSAPSNHFILIFTQYPNPQDKPAVISIMHQYLTPDDYIQDPKLFSDFPNVKKILVADSIDGVKKAVAKAANSSDKISAIAYDLEHWKASPDSEQSDPIGSMNAAASIVHDAGYQFSFVPDGRFLYSYYKQIDWKKVDIAWLQIGYNQANKSTFDSVITDMVKTVRTKNLNSTIIVQLSLRFMNDTKYSNPVDQFNDEVNTLVKLKVNGVSVVYLSPVRSPAYTIPNLQTILTHIENMTS